MTYRQLHAKYLRDANRLVKKKDRVQTSEKYWGATAELLKIVAESRDWPHHRHRDLLVVVSRLYGETGDANLARDFDMAQALHANFYEDFMDEKLFRLHTDQVNILIDTLQKLNGKK